MILNHIGVYTRPSRHLELILSGGCLASSVPLAGDWSTSDLSKKSLLSSVKTRSILLVVYALMITSDNEPSIWEFLRIKILPVLVQDQLHIIDEQSQVVYFIFPQ